jgi:acyl-CoA thioester hydrolase
MTGDRMQLPSASVTIQIPFHDVDLMAVAWHGHYVKYFEIARGALLDKVNYNYREMKESGYSWPVIDLRIRYAKPAHFGQEVEVVASLAEYDLRLKIDYLIRDAASGTRLTKGHTIQVAVDHRTGEMLLGSPPVLYEKLGLET